MPIRLNLLAEAQAQEELRRRDPVKRVIWVGVVIVVGMLVWSSSIQVRALLEKGYTTSLEAQLASKTNQYRIVLENQQRVTEISQKLASLRLLAASRFLQGNLLDAMQHVMVDDVQMARLRTEQVYVYTEPVKGGTNTEGKAITPKPASATEKIAIIIEARDTAANPGDQVPLFKQAIASSPYFSNLLEQAQVRLASISPPQALPGAKPAVNFTLECRLPEKTR